MARNTEITRVLTSGFGRQRYAGLLLRWIRHDFDARYRRSALSVGWAFVQPFVALLVYVFIFGVLFDQNGGELPYLSFLLSGIIIYSLVTRALSTNSSLVDSHGVIAHLRFPRELIPLSQLIGTSFDVLVLLPAFLVIAWAQGIEFGPPLLLLPAVLLSVALLSAGVCVLVSTVQVFVRDLQFAIVPFCQILFFASPISYSEDQVPAGLRWLNALNPISVDIAALRDVALRERWPEGLFYAHALGAAALFVLAIAHLRSVQHRIVDLA